ncbi:hypothetical protein TRFO_41150 [Tritrichomonas foetus]|uniref:Leucine Rich Repeat family protein n=1 Tax=Tritrichomonas foetus TaxID=1144522 RepID=A0A1J4L185_9EUKA|nr:hypothetical protein TRFO_41150 [Tritrichomonas foetus]|eukprot:OHT17279.1 hypothetical protein TRFO_41150 [Tritrichomonas foetus]
MLKNVVLEFDGVPEKIEVDTILYSDRDFSNVRSLEAIADTREMSLSFLGDRFPNLEKLRLNNSQISSIRDISTSLKKLRFLSLAHCGLNSLDGIATLSPKLEELYLAFNEIHDLNELMGLDSLRIIDLEENSIKSVDEVEFLSYCKNLRAATLTGNPCADSETYRKDVIKHCPQLIYLDEKRLKPKRPPSSQNAKRSTSNGTHNITDNSNPLNEPQSSITQVRIINEEVPKSNDNLSLANTKNGSKVKFAPIEVAKIEKGEKCGVKPNSAEIHQRPSCVTEYIEDIADERPPTAGGVRGGGILSSWAKPKQHQKLSQKLIVTPKIARPVSSCMNVRAGKY